MCQRKNLFHDSLIFSVALLAFAFFPQGIQAQTFNSQSNGTDGALDFTWAIPTTGTTTVIFDPSDPATFDPASPARRLDVDNDNIFHFTTIFIPGKVTVVLTAPKLNWAPVYWLVTGDVVIERNATLDLSGQNGHPFPAVGNERFPSIPGPGGFPGGLGASAFHLAQPGFGPGGGKPRGCDCGGGGPASHATLGNNFNNNAGLVYGSPYPGGIASTRISVLVPGTPFLPGVHPIVPLRPSIHVESINGIVISQEPSASFSVPDAIVPTSGPVTVVFKTTNIPTNASLTFHITSNEAAVLKVSPTFISGVEAGATWQGTVSFPLGFSRGYLQATWTPPAP